MTKTVRENLAPGADDLASGDSAARKAAPLFRPLLIGPIGLALAWLAFQIVVQMEQIQRFGFPTGMALYYHVVVIFGVLLIINRACSRFFSCLKVLSRAELLCIYSMMNIGACFACWEALPTLIPSLAYPAYWLSDSSVAAWAIPILNHLPAWALVHDPTAARAIFQGGRWSDVWPGWAVPLTIWGLLLSGLFVYCLVLTRLLWTGWARNERLTFPLTILPLQMTDPQSGLGRSPGFWIGAGAAALFDILNGLHQIVPALPSLNVKVNTINTVASDPAWAAVGGTPITTHPVMIAIGLLLRTDLLFSTWFFYLLGKAQLYVAGANGVAKGSPYAFGGNVPGLLAQNLGSMLIISAGLLWGARRAAAERWSAARSGDRSAIFDVVVVFGGFAGLMWFLGQLGMPLWESMLASAIMLVLAVFVSRLRAELGMPVHNLQFTGPVGPITAAFNGNGLTAHGIEGLGAIYALTRSEQGQPMPHQMEAVTMGDRADAPQNSLYAILAVTGIIFAMVGPWLLLHSLTQRGLELLPGGYNPPISSEGWRWIHSTLEQAHVMDRPAVIELAAGMLVTLGLIALQRIWITSPFHPVGYAICGSWGTGFVWCPFLIAWVIKTLILRYGGLDLYRKTIQIALGVILGEFVAAMFWAAYAFAAGVPTYQIWLF